MSALKDSSESSPLVRTISMLLSITKLCYLITMYLLNDYNIYYICIIFISLILLVEITTN